jgi:uncharacterized membrane protein YidH (DUF202 family)
MMRWFPLDPWWLSIPIAGLVVGAAAVVSHDGSFLVMYAMMFIAIGCATMGMDRWYERHHARRRHPRR